MRRPKPKEISVAGGFAAGVYPATP